MSLFGKDPRNYRQQIAKNVSSVFGQRSQLLYNLPLIDSFNFFKIVYEIPDQLYQDRLNKFINRFGIQDFINDPVRKLSLGQRMKGEIVASLLHGPKALFLDEPTV
ncbi:MAG: ATP-binding cassette domain-containing protein [Patescibacteria group bacterium]